MTRDVNKRITQLRNRRSGVDSLSRLAEDAQIEVLAKSFSEEPWQTRADAKPYTRYTLGAMQEVGQDYTRISVETAQRVQRQLDAALSSAGFSVDFRLQGSVPLNVHIRGISDVDLLNLDTGFFTYDRIGVRSQRGQYTNPTAKTSLGVLFLLRAEAEKILKEKFPAATVDTSGGKAIKIFGGSLARPVDVVPSHWHDTAAFQASGEEHDRGVTILDKKTSQTVDNLPFLHIKLIENQDALAIGGLRKAIRLCKNVKSDAEEEGTKIELPSFDIASVMYHANLQALQSGRIYELAVLAETQRHLDFLARNIEYAKTLKVPDGSRQIFDSTAKLQGLINLSIEMNDLAREVAKEHNILLAIMGTPSLSESRTVIEGVVVPIL